MFSCLDWYLGVVDVSFTGCADHAANPYLQLVGRQSNGIYFHKTEVDEHVRLSVLDGRLPPRHIRTMRERCVMTTTLYLVRHCQSLPSRQVAKSEWPLSSRGARQAGELVPVLAALGADAIHSSPYRRCIDTLEPTATRLRLRIETDPELRERLVSPGWVGDFREFWRRSWEDLSFALEGGEPSIDCRNRVTQAIDRIAEAHGGQTVLVGSHGNATALFLSGFTPGYGIKEASALRTPELLKVTHGPRGYLWHRDFRSPEAFDLLATEFRETPGIRI